MIPKATRATYLRARYAGATQMGEALWWWAACRQAAINAENAARWGIVEPETLCEDGSRRSPDGGSDAGEPA